MGRRKFLLRENYFSLDGVWVDGVLVEAFKDVVFNIPGGATAADYDGRAFIARRKYEVVAVKEQHQTLGTDAGAVTVMVAKVPSGTAKASGTDTLSTGISLKATADTIQNGTLHATVANRRLALNDSLALVTTGVLTAVDGVTVHVYLKPIT